MMWREQRKKVSTKGSLTVEACLALPVFLAFFFLLLFFTKIACLNIVLDQAVKETARQIAAQSYVLNFFNEYLDNQVLESKPVSAFWRKEGEKVQAIGEKNLEDSLLTAILTGKIEKSVLEKTWGKVKEEIKGEGLSLVENALIQVLAEPFFHLKAEQEEYLVQKILESQLPNGQVKPKQLRLTLVKLPQGVYEYEDKKAEIYHKNKESGLIPDVDFHKDDVVLQVEYKAILPLPFFGLMEILLCHTAVERAWLFGGNGIYAAGREEEGIDFSQYKQNPQEPTSREETEEDEEEYVYICRSPTEVYHPYRHCKYIADKSGVKRISLKEAKSRGLRVHAGCPELFK